MTADSADEKVALTVECSVCGSCVGIGCVMLCHRGGIDHHFTRFKKAMRVWTTEQIHEILT